MLYSELKIFWSLPQSDCIRLNPYKFKKTLSFHKVYGIIKIMNTYKISEFAKLISVSSGTLRNWDKSGALKAHRTPTGHRFYTHKQYEEYMGIAK